MQDPKTGKLVPKGDYYARGIQTHAVHGDIESFVSHVDGTIIDSRRKLREHNARNGVETAEFDSAAIKARQAEREALYAGKPFDRTRRLDALRFAVEANRGGRTKAEVKEMAERYRDSN